MTAAADRLAPPVTTVADVPLLVVAKAIRLARIAAAFQRARNSTRGRP
jgi:hypothetical protein